MCYPAAVLTFLIAAIFVPSGARAQSILFIGNSFTYADYGAQAQSAGGVPQLFARIAHQSGQTPETRMVAPGGSSMHQHFDGKSGEIDAIQSRKWDYVVLQGYSLDPTTAAPHVGDFLEYGKKLAAIIRKNNPATKIVLYETWAYPKGHPVFSGKLTDQAQMLDQIAAGYRALAREIDATAIAPVGDAFYEAETCPRHYDLYTSKPPFNIHSNDLGYTLSALVFVRVIYGEGALLVDPKPVLTDITPEDMQWLTSIANSNVRAWNHADPLPASVGAESAALSPAVGLQNAAPR